MIENKQVNAKIDSEKAMVSFIEQDDGDNQLYDIIKQLEGQNERIMDLMQGVEKTDANILKSNSYIKNSLTVSIIG